MSEEQSIKHWQQVESTRVYQGRWMQVDIDKVTLPNGQLYDYTVIRNQRDGAAIFALNENGKVLLQREYRYPVDQVIWQLPGGLIDPGETPLQAAQRELQEEAGMRAGLWRELGVIFDNPAFEELKIHIFLAEEVSADGLPAGDEAEWVEHHWVTIDWLRTGIRQGDIREGSSGWGSGR